MSVRISQIVRMLKGVKLNFPVYSDYIPEGVTVPAVAVTNITNGHNRAIEGVKYGGSSMWRVTVVARRTNDVESIVESIEKLDNTKNADFQKIKAWLVTFEPRDPLQKSRRAFVDVQVYE